MGRSWGRLTVLCCCTALLLTVLVGQGSHASAQTGEDLVEACEPLEAIPEVGPRTCAGMNALVWLAAQTCRRVPGAQEPVCPSVDGREIHETALVDYEAGWTARALDLQRDLDLDVPLTESMTISTHNSANTAADAPSLTIADANQVVSLTDQLRLGIRGLEIDLHWTPHPDGASEGRLRTVVQCHGQSAETPLGSVHLGCTLDRPFDDVLDEIRTWLDRPEAADEIVLLYLENQLVGDETAHRSAVASLEHHLGELLYRPAEGDGCQPMPGDVTKREILATGARVLVVGNCGPAGWTDLVFERGEAWDESGSNTGYPHGRTCEAERAQSAYGDRYIRRYEDSTFLSRMAGGGSHIDAEAATWMARCGVNLPGLDQVHAGDDRLPALVWSWREGDRGDEPDAACAAQGADGRIGARPCTDQLRVACRTTTGGWAVTDEDVAWDEVDSACTAAGHAGAGTPANGWETEQLRGVAGDREVWLAYARDADGAWGVGPPAERPSPGSGRPDRPDHAGPPLPPARPDHAGAPDPGAAADERGQVAARRVDAPRMDEAASTRDVLATAATLAAVLLLAGLVGGSVVDGGTMARVVSRRSRRRG